MLRNFYHILGVFYLLGTVSFVVSCEGEATENNQDEANNLLDRLSIADERFEQALIDLNFDDTLDGFISKR